jgi:hypothetical protein
MNQSIEDEFIQVSITELAALRDMFEYSEDMFEAIARPEAVIPFAIRQLKARQSSQSEPVAEYVRFTGDGKIFSPYNGFKYRNDYVPQIGDKLYAAPQQAIPSGWISVDDTLPSNPEERVLAMETDGEVYRLYYRDGKWLDIDGYELLAVHAWMEFPEMYDLSASPTAPIERDK